MELKRTTFTGPDGFRTVYYRGGSGVPLVFLHGGGIAAGCYRELLKLLAERYDVIAPNLAGHGGSSAAGTGWSWSSYAEQVRSLLNHLGLPDAVAVGHSFGGGVAAHLAAGGGVSKLVLIDSAGRPLRWSAASVLKLMVWQRLVDSCRYRKLAVTFRLISSFLGNLVRAGVGAPAAATTMRRLLTGSSDVFTQVRVPTVVLWGDADEVFPPAAGEEISSLISGSKMESVSGDHEWCLYQPGLAAEKITGWAQGYE